MIDFEEGWGWGGSSSLLFAVIMFQIREKWMKCEEKEDNKNECEEEDQIRNETKGMRGRENDQNMREHLKGEKRTVLARPILIAISN